MKKVVSLALCIIVSFSTILTGCNGKNSKETAEQESITTSRSSVVTANGTFPVTEKKTTLRFFTQKVASLEDIETNEFTKEYEQKTNVHIDWSQYSGTALNDARKLSIASNDLPDVFFAAQVTPDEEVTNGEAGTFIALNELIDKYSVHFKKMMTEYPTVKAAITTPSGAIYSLPRTNENFAGQFNRRMYFNKKWLENLGLKVPTTTDEFYQVLKAFKDKDPNNNGKNDEIPYIISNTGLTSFTMNSFIYDDGDERFTVDKNNKVDVAFNKPEWRMGLEYLRKLYAEGLLDKQSFTILTATTKKLIGSSLIGAIIAPYGSAIADNAGTGMQDYDTIPPLKGPNGVQLATSKMYLHNSGTFVITKALKDPEIAMRWVDWLYSWEGGIRAREGRENIEWARPAPGTLSYMGIPATWERTTVVPDVQNYCYNGIIFPHSTMANKEMKDDVRAKPNYEEAVKYEPYKAKSLPDLYMNNEDTQEFERLRADITKFVNDSIKKYVAGDSDVTKDWDNYVKTLDNMGVKRYIEIKQKYYDSFLKNNPYFK